MLMNADTVKSLRIDDLPRVWVAVAAEGGKRAHGANHASHGATPD
jgi:hypothetical protein